MDAPAADATQVSPPAAEPARARDAFVRLGLPALGLLASQLLSFASMWAVSHALGADSYGRLGLAMIAAVYAAMFVQWGVDPLLTRALARGTPESSRRTLAAFLRQRQFSGALALVLGAVVALVWPQRDEALLVWLGVADGVLLAYSAAGAFDARGRMTAYFAINALRQSVYLAAVLALIKFAPQLVSPLIFLAAHLCGVLVQISIEWFWVRRAYGAPDWTESHAGGKALWRESAPLAFGACALQALLVSGPLALEVFGRQSELGWLVLSNQLITVASSFLTIPSRQIHASLALADPAGSAFQRQVWRQTFLWSAFGALTALVLTFVAMPLVATVFKADFAPAGTLLSIEAWRLPGVLATAVLSSALICQNRIRACALCHLAALLCTAVLLVVNVPVDGAVAAANAVVVGRFTFPVLAALLVLFGKPVAEPRK